MAFSPTPLGEALVGGYRDMQLNNLWLPNLRAKIEQTTTLVAQSRRIKARIPDRSSAYIQPAITKSACWHSHNHQDGAPWASSRAPEHCSLSLTRTAFSRPRPVARLFHISRHPSGRRS